MAALVNHFYDERFAFKGLKHATSEGQTLTSIILAADHER